MENNKTFFYIIAMLLISTKSSATIKDTTVYQKNLIQDATCAVQEKQYQKAIDIYEKLYIQKSEDASILYPLANLYLKKNELIKSAKLYTKLIKLNKANSFAYYNFAWALNHLGLKQESIRYYKKLLATNPTQAQYHYELAEVYLAIGNYSHGWKEFEWRGQSKKDSRELKKNTWNGVSDLKGKRMLIRCEYGLGDSIQFIRYAQNLKELGAYVILESQTPLIKLFSMLPYLDEVFPVFKTPPAHDVQIRLMSLAKIFSQDEESIPHKTPYLQADDELISLWETKLEHDKKFKVGIAWCGNKKYDASLPPFSRRTLEPDKLLPLYNDNTSFYSLQTHNINKTIPQELHINIFDEKFDREHGRFMDTAALIMNLDLIITIDTSIAHLAGALGKPVWLLLPYVADWRWQQHKTHSPWYPQMVLFRQSKPNNWEYVIDKIIQKLQPLVQKNFAISGPT